MGLTSTLLREADRANWHWSSRHISPPQKYNVTFATPLNKWLPRCCPFSPAASGDSHSASLHRLVVFLSTLTAVISPPFHRSPLPSLPSSTHTAQIQRSRMLGKIRVWCCLHGPSDTSKCQLPKPAGEKERVWFSIEWYLIVLVAYNYIQSDFPVFCL